MAGEDGLAVTIFGLVDNITKLTFLNNSFYCDSGKYGWREDIDDVEVCPFPTRLQILSRRVQEETLLILRWGQSVLAVQLCD